MQPLDKNQIPTGYLEEYGCPMLPAATFNGTLTDSNRIDMNLWRTLYFQLQTGWTRVDNNPLPAITSVNSTIKQNISSSLPTPIPLLIAEYNTVKNNAFSSNLLSYNNISKQVNDVLGRTQSPYELKTLFAACPNKKITTLGNEKFIVQSSMIWNNTNKTINQIQIDFANGQGLQTVTIGTPINISYADTGFKKWTVRITLNDNSILECYNEYYVLRIANFTSRFQTNESAIPTWGFINSVNGIRNAATVWINYSKNNPTGTLRKPLIVVEGYDVSTIAPALQPFNYSVVDFINGIDEPKLQYDFNTQLDNIAGYDLVFVDFADGAADIVLNAGAVQEVINRVNANKVIDDRFSNIRQQNVVMGLSMGGLCARYALANMTKNFIVTPTETRLLITHDSPHKGANVPLGLQYMIRMMGGVQLFGLNVYDIYPEYDEAIGLFNAPATQQLLLYRATTDNAFINNNFLDATYRPMITFAATDPQPTYRFIATANGNECAVQRFGPGKTFINLGAGVSAGITGRVLFFRVPILQYKLAAEVEAYSLPSTGSTGKIARVYTINNLNLFGFINIFKQLYNNTAYAPGSQLPVDGVPGSSSPLLDVEALNQLTNLSVFRPINLYIQFPLGPFLGGYFGAYAYNQGVAIDFTFVPVGSALDVSPLSMGVFYAKYVNGFNQYFPSKSETFIAQESVSSQSLYNNAHIQFTARNARWMYKEMENLPNTENCSGDCSSANQYFMTGASSICSGSAVYSVPVNRGTSVTWTATPTNIVSINNPNTPAITVTMIGDGNITLTASIVGSCNGNLSLTKQVSVGSPWTCSQVGNGTCTIQVPRCSGMYYAEWGYFLPNPFLAGVSQWKWEATGAKFRNGTNLLFTAPSSDPTYITPDYGTGSAVVYVRPVNACGIVTTSGEPFKFIIINTGQPCANNFIVTPNPATTAITISANLNSPDVPLKSINQIEFSDIEIVSKMGVLVKKIKYLKGTTKATIDISSLKSDIYILRVFNQKYFEEHKIIINK